MKLKDQVISIPQAMRLNELGISQESLFYHTQDKTPTNSNLPVYGYRQVNMPFRITYGKQSKLSTANIYIEFSAFTVAELGVLLPDVYAHNQWVTISNAGVNKTGENIEPPNCFSLHIGETFADLDHEPFDEELYPSEAQARGAYLIMLLEEKAIDPEECNQRLTK